MIEYLEWDSDFLGLQTGRINLVNIEDTEDLLRKAMSLNYKLVYIFDKNAFGIDESICNQFNGALVDKKVVYAKSIQALGNLNFEQVYDYVEDTPRQVLYDLALESGRFSRFKTDSHFEEVVFKQMYYQWIKKSVEKKMADFVFVSKSDKQITGMVTLSVQSATAKIGLIATLPEFQGMGFGKKLINKCIDTAISNQCSEIEVPTQAENIQACNFYNSCGFGVKEITDIYHFWL
jgi:dTDP-4-amino-4,6-dideoxy-D-galactose acyltransferase